MNKKRQSVCVIAAHVVVIHAAALTLMVSSSPVQPTAHQAPKTAVASVVMQARLNPRAATPPEVPPTIPSMEAPIPAPQAITDVPPPPADTVAPTAPISEDQTVANAEVASPAPLADPGDNYFPRPLLSMPPKSSTPVIVPFPEQITEPGRYTTILALFIDENGVVRRVRIDGPSLPKPLEDAARDSFLQAHFQPGEVQGQQVKSLIRVEVVFDNTPIESPAATQSL
ncbi:energy transducer TonB [Aquabacterium sp.]|uniref:energy transducer TonB n=1 Tax=Aquabacterium sp. TaxID=1872578 RepID=UPI002489B96B|nr:energy transducer TonB [Aquabacterium sp.]MDI1259490.1 energy transducer TonB [Aquabacterium sp.]